MSRAVAVFISDVHFTIPTLEIASFCFEVAAMKALELKVPLVIAGDLLDGKAIIRAEVANRLISLFKKYHDVYIVLIPGNHDKINEKSEDHALNFLAPYCSLISVPLYDSGTGFYFIPYQSNPNAFYEALAAIPKNSTVICHQGIQGANMGHYVLDKSAISKESVADYRIISGHYHRAQDIKCGRPRKGAVGLFSYIGNPYTLSFGEASDGPKGFQVLDSGGVLTKMPIDVRRHMIMEYSVEDLKHAEYQIPANVILWLKVKGPFTELEKIDKTELGAKIGHSDFKLEKIYTDAPVLKEPVENMTDYEIFDDIIDATDESSDKKEALKSLWKRVLDEAP